MSRESTVVFLKEGTTIVTADDLRVDPLLDADDHVAVMIVDRNATLITPTLVSQCH